MKVGVSCRSTLRDLGVALYSEAIVERGSSVVCEVPCKIGGDISFKGSIGAFSYVRKGGRLSPGLKSIGRFCSIAPNVYIGDGNHPTNWLSTHPFQWGKDPFGSSPAGKIKLSKDNASIVVGNDVWIGANVIVVPKVTIGDGAIIGAGSVVTKDVPPYAIVGGVPAKVIKYRFGKEQIEELSELQWWNYDVFGLEDLTFNNIDVAIRSIKESLQAGSLVKLEPRNVSIDYKGSALQIGVSPNSG